MTTKLRPAARALTEEQIKVVLESSLTSRQLAQIMGVSMHTIQKIRRHESYRQVLPDIPRQTVQHDTTCEQCIHWLKERCSMGFPEAQRSMLFARRCAAFMEAQQ